MKITNIFRLWKLQQQEQLMYGEEGTCTLCSKTFARKSSLLTHIRNHTAERKYQCPTCQKSTYKSIFATFRFYHRKNTKANLTDIDILIYSIHTGSQSTES